MHVNEDQNGLFFKSSWKRSVIDVCMERRKMNELNGRLLRTTRMVGGEGG